MSESLIYCVEDEESIRELVAYVLRGQGFAVEIFEKPAEFWTALKARQPDLLLLDVMLPEEDGYSILNKLRNQSSYANLPVIMVTAKTSEFDVVHGLDKGADDYITKPFSVVEMVSRIRAVLRRVKHSNRKVSSLTGEYIHVDKQRHIVEVEDKEVELTRKEYDLLIYLMENKNLVLTREQIMNAVWSFDYEGESRTIDMHIKTLRQKLGVAAKSIKTVRGVGYRWRNKTELEQD